MKPNSTVLSSVPIADGSAMAKAVESRGNIFDMTQAAEDAVLRPKDTGRWNHALRAAFAARIANLNNENDLAQRYVINAGEFANLTQPAENGAAHGLLDVVSFMDKVAADTRNVSAEDITQLTVSGVADADIVRLAELNAFMAYQIRVIAALRLIGALA